MRIRNFNIMLMLVAGIIVTIISVLEGYTIEHLMYTLIIILVVFFIIGSFIQRFINRVAAKADENERERERLELDSAVQSYTEKMTDKK